MARLVPRGASARGRSVGEGRLRGGCTLAQRPVIVTCERSTANDRRRVEQRRDRVGLVRLDLPRPAARPAVEVPVRLDRQDVELLAAVDPVVVAARSRGPRGRRASGRRSRASSPDRSPGSARRAPRRSRGRTSATGPRRAIRRWGVQRRPCACRRSRTWSQPAGAGRSVITHPRRPRTAGSIRGSGRPPSSPNRNTVPMTRLKIARDRARSRRRSARASGWRRTRPSSGARSRSSRAAGR